MVKLPGPVKGRTAHWLFPRVIEDWYLWGPLGGKAETGMRQWYREQSGLLRSNKLTF